MALFLCFVTLVETLLGVHFMCAALAGWMRGCVTSFTLRPRTSRLSASATGTCAYNGYKLSESVSVYLYLYLYIAHTWTRVPSQTRRACPPVQRRGLWGEHWAQKTVLHFFFLGHLVLDGLLHAVSQLPERVVERHDVAYHRVSNALPARVRALTERTDACTHTPIQTSRHIYADKYRCCLYVFMNACACMYMPVRMHHVCMHVCTMYVCECVL